MSVIIYILFNFYIQKIIFLILFSVLGSILLRKSLKIKSDVCQNCGNKISQEKVCPKCSSIINNKEKTRKILLIFGSICCVIAGYNLLKIFKVIISLLFNIYF